MIFSPRLVRGFFFVFCISKATTIFVVAHFNFTANFAEARVSVFRINIFTVSD